MKRIAISCLLLLAMLTALLPMTVGAFADEPAGGNTAEASELTYKDLYVQDGLTALLVAYDPANDGVVIDETGAGVWQNQLTGKPLTSATLNGAFANAVGEHVFDAPSNPTAGGTEEVLKSYTKETLDADGNKLYRVTTKLYSDTALALTDSDRYQFVGEDGKTYELTKMTSTLEVWNGTEYTTDGEYTMGGWRANEDGGIGFRLPDFAVVGGIFADHFICAPTARG